MNDNTPLDQATANRLKRLNAMPVDATSLEARLRAQIPLPDRLSRRVFSWKGMAAIAASLAVIGAVLAVVLQSSGPVMASTTEMVRFHEDLVAGKTEVVKVDSIEEAGKALAAQWNGAGTLPNVPTDHVMACCMKSVQNKRVACVLLQSKGVPVTLVVADEHDVKAPASGSGWYVHQTGGLNMVMGNRKGKMICLIGQLPKQELVAMAEAIR